MFQMEQRINSRYDVGSDNGVINVSQELLPRGDSFNQSDFLQFSSSGAGEGGDGGLDDLEIPLIIKKCVLLDNLSRNSNKITVDFYKLFIKVSKTLRALVVWSLFSQR